MPATVLPVLFALFACDPNTSGVPAPPADEHETDEATEPGSSSLSGQLTGTDRGAESDGGTETGSDGDTGADPETGSEDEHPDRSGAVPWPVGSGADIYAAFVAAVPDIGSAWAWHSTMHDYLRVLASVRGVAIEDLDCIEVQEDPFVLDGGDGCMFTEGVHVAGRAEEAWDGERWSLTYENFEFRATFDALGMGGEWSFDAHGQYWTQSAEGEDPEKQGAAVRLRSRHSSTHEYAVYYDGFDFRQDIVFEIGEGFSRADGQVEVFESPSGGPTGAFRIEVDASDVDECSLEGSTRIAVLGDAVGVLLYQGHSSCDGCADVYIDDVESGGYCGS